MNRLIGLFPEFVFSISYSIVTARRSSYNGDTTKCCLSRITAYTVNEVVFTCTPTSRLTDSTRECDFALSNYCLNNPSDSSLCKTWFTGLVRQTGYNNFYVNQMYSICYNNFESPFCYEFLTIMRNNPDATQYDNFLKAISKNYPNDFRCSFPSPVTLNKAKKISYPRQCWDSNCINTLSWKLLYYDYVIKQNCKVSNSSINFTITPIDKPKSINSIQVENSNDIPNLTTIVYENNQNIYTQSLKTFNKGYLDFWDLKQFVFVGLLSLFVIFN